MTTEPFDTPPLFGSVPVTPVPLDEAMQFTFVGQLRNPVFVIALAGLFDAGEAATLATRHLAKHHRAFEIAAINPDFLFDFTQRRPRVAFGSDGKRMMTWPENRILGAIVEGRDRDLVILSGVEPHFRWRTFVDHLLDIAHQASTGLVITLGSSLGLTPHSRSPGVVATSPDPILAKRLGLGAPKYKGPTGVAGVIQTRFAVSTMPVISLRVSVPHYVPGSANPEAARSLLARLELITGIATNHQALEQDAKDWQQRINVALETDDEMRAYVTNLEKQLDAVAEEHLPSGDELAAELQAYLRDQ
ncbi:MAG: PAC2 family protein [Acidimicrobiales bacterium]